MDSLHFTKFGFWTPPLKKFSGSAPELNFKSVLYCTGESDYLTDMKPPSYIFCARDSDKQFECVRDNTMGGAYMQDSSSIVVTLSILLFVLLSRTITC